MPDRAPQTARVILLFAIGFVVLGWPWLSGHVTIPWDAKAQFHPQLQFLASSLAKGEAPFWTPYVFAGWPQLADPQSLIFSPLHVLLALLQPQPSFRSDDLVTFAYLFAGGIGMILLFRDRHWHPAGALVAALMFAFGGSAAWRLQHTGQVMSLAYVPLALWLLARALARGSLMSGLAAGAIAGLLAAGRDQVAMLGLFLLAGFAVWQTLAADAVHAGLRRAAGPLLACIVAATLVAVVPLTFTALLALESNRPAFDFVSAGRGSLHPVHLLTFAVSDLFGAADPRVDYWGPPSFAWNAAFAPSGLFLAQNMGQLYAGILAPMLILGTGLAAGRLWDREIRFFALALLATVLYALGWYTPAFRLLYEVLPGVTLFRRPADATFILGLLVALCTGYLVHVILSEPLHRSSVFAGLIGVAALLAASAALAAVVVPAPADLRVLVPALVCGLAAPVVLLSARRLKAPGAAMLLGAAVVIDLAWNNAPNESTGLPPATYDAMRPDTDNETVRLLKAKVGEGAGRDRRDRVEMVGIGYHWPNLGLSHGIEHLFGQNPLRLRDFARVTGVGDTVAVPEQRTFAPAYPSYRSTLADLFGVRFIATGVPVEQIDRRLSPGDLRLIARTPDAFVYENPRALPRVLFVPTAQPADFAAMIRNGWPDVDPRRTVLLEHVAATPEPAAAATGKAAIVAYSSTAVEVAVEAEGAGFLVLNDVWHPWWRVALDGRPAPLLKANILFRAVAVPAGRHRVRFAFHPFAGAWQQLTAKLH